MVIVLNKQFPQLSSRTSEFPTITDVQRPLQTMYERYIQSFLKTLFLLKEIKYCMLHLESENLQGFKDIALTSPSEGPRFD